MTQAAKTIVAGLGAAKGESFVFRNFARSQLITILRRVKLDTEFGQMRYAAYLYSLRAPSDALAARRAFADDPLLGFAPKRGKALMGARGYKQADILVLKFDFRKNIRDERILKRPCFLSERNPLARLLFPPHTLWLLIKQRAQAGDLIPRQLCG